MLALALASNLARATNMMEALTLNYNLFVEGKLLFIVKMIWESLEGFGFLWSCFLKD